MCDCSIAGKCDPALPVCLGGEVPSFLHAVVWQQKDEDWAHYYKLLIGKIYPHDFEGFSRFLLLRIHFCVYLLICCSHVVVNLRVSWPQFSSQVEEVSALWNSGIKQKGCSSTGGGGEKWRVKHVSSSFLLTAYWPPCAIAGNLEVGVHIADVSYFVLEETALDKVASERATSVYLVQKVRTAFPLSLWWLCLPLTIN